SGNSSSSVLPSAKAALNSPVLAFSSSSSSLAMSSPSALIAVTRRLIRLSSRSFLVPKTFFAMEDSMKRPFFLNGWSRAPRAKEGSFYSRDWVGATIIQALGGGIKTRVTVPDQWGRLTAPRFSPASARDGGLAARPSDIRGRIHLLAVLQHFVMHMGTGGTAAAADNGDGIAGAHDIPDLHGHA